MLYNLSFNLTIMYSFDNIFINYKTYYLKFYIFAFRNIIILYALKLYMLFLIFIFPKLIILYEARV